MREGGESQRVGRPQDQLRQVKIARTNREPAIRTNGNAAPSDQHQRDGPVRTAPRPSNVRRAFAVRKENAAPNQKANRRTSGWTNPDGYSKPQVLWYPRPNSQSPVKKPLVPAPYGKRPAATPGLAPVNKVKATRLSNRRPQVSNVPPGSKTYRTGSKFNQPYSWRPGAAQSRPRETLVVQSYDDPVDPRYKQTINYIVGHGNGRLVIKRLKHTANGRPQHNGAAPNRGPSPRRRSQIVWTQRTRS